MIQLPRTARSVFVCPANVSSFFFPRPTECEGKEKTFSFRWKTPPFSNLWSLAAIFRIPDFNVLFGRLSVVVFIYTPIIIKCWLFYF